jgi:hypothetical protein
MHGQNSDASHLSAAAIKILLLGLLVPLLLAATPSRAAFSRTQCIPAFTYMVDTTTRGECIGASKLCSDVEMLENRRRLAMTTAEKVSDGQRRQMIADAAYFLAERRGLNRDPVADWLEAEAEVDARLRGSNGEHLLDRAEERLAATSKKLRALREKLVEMPSEARKEWEHDVEKLAKLHDRFQERVREIRVEGQHASDKAKQQAEKIWDEVSEIIERLSSRRKERTQ